jgi:hypothetical protein
MAYTTAEPIVGYAPTAGLGHASVSVGESTNLPRGFPLSVQSPLAWTGQQFDNRSDFIYHLDEEDRQEITGALDAFKSM